MKTEISKFCDACLLHLTPLSPALEKAAADLEQGSDQAVLERPLAALNDIRARLRSLMEKLASQQAYLLIFGPLKSGKSTLMNAISGAYVSEVTSLPGYPCLVFVRNAEQPHFSVTRYNGRETVFASGAVLKDVIEDSHLALAEQIRETEMRGDDFDPRTHFTEAIRRVDVKLPVQSLAESSTVLVDTPGLYSRMNFGYDVLTREFRDSAACAVFVVKTDNLFLEQVFAEFNQLLGLFSRIFLVINVDSSKRDLHADGSLQPSAESRDPDQIIEAFKTLSMAGPFRQAYEEKRVRIHAVDLLNAASSFLSGATNGHGHPSGNGHGDGNGHASVADPGAAQKKAFDAFLRDLTDYLNSSDYTVEFIRDSLRQGQTLCTEVREIFASDEILALRAKQTFLENELSALEERAAAVDRLLAVDWDATFKKVREENVARGKESFTPKAARVTKEMSDALDRWFETSESVQTLVQKHWNPLLAAAGRALGDDTRSRLTALLGPPLGGAEPPALVMNDLHTVGFSLVPVAEEAVSEIRVQENAAPYAMSVAADQIPVRKTFVDWILFRKAATVRRRLFGEDLTLEVPPEVKAERLPDASREALRELIRENVQTRFPAAPEKFATAILSGYVGKFLSELLRGLREMRERLSQERIEQQTPVEANRRLLASQQELHETATRVSETLDQLTQQENTALPGATLDEAIEAVSGRDVVPAEHADRLHEQPAAAAISAEPARS